MDLDDDRQTENTRAVPAGIHRQRRQQQSWAGHPKNVLFLTCDAQGVVPPIARLTPR
ncbi:MAG: phosphoenolpyruvate carboxykinase (ATP) [Anaerolineae bacterium]